MAKSYFNVPALEQIFRDCVELGKRKNHDYGAARDTILDNGVRGVATRMDDKMARILSLTQVGHEAAVKDESLRDTFRDMLNYSAYGLMLLDGTWGVQPAPGKVVENLTLNLANGASIEIPKAEIRRSATPERHAIEIDMGENGKLYMLTKDDTIVGSQHPSQAFPTYFSPREELIRSAMAECKTVKPRKKPKNKPKKARKK